jgi:hypothetical protein
MDSREQHDLEKFIHEQLRKLPDRPAPENLAGKVLARIEASRNLPWWKRSFISWPRGAQTVFIITLSSLLGALVYVASIPAEQFSLSALVTHAQSLSWIGELFDALLGSVLLIVKSLTWQWFAGIAGVFAIMYSVCVAGGMALYRVATLGRLRRN